MVNDDGEDLALALGASPLGLARALWTQLVATAAVPAPVRLLGRRHPAFNGPQIGGLMAFERVRVCYTNAHLEALRRHEIRSYEIWRTLLQSGAELGAAV